MNYITTNIRLKEADYQKLKAEAARKRKSFAAIVREKLTTEKHIITEEKANTLLRELDQIATKNAKVLKEWNSQQVLREIRET